MSAVECQNDVFDSPKAKKLKISLDSENGKAETPFKLSEFEFKKILNNNSNRKTVCVLGSFKNKSGDALIIFEKNAFKEDDLNDKGYFGEESELCSLFQNDIYGNYECFPKPSINGVKATVIHPATPKHIEKFNQQEIHIILETPDLYERVTLPHLLKDQFTLEWVYNILEEKSEQDRVVYVNKCEKDGFVLLPDLKWDGKTRENLYLLAIVRRRDIKSLRDLSGEHLTLLKNIREEGKKAIFDKYQISGSQLRIYIHYQPSFYHLHVHFTYLKHDAPGIYAEKSHLLDTVIDNIEMMSDYYKKASIPFVLREMDSLFKAYQSENVVQKIEPVNINPCIEVELIDK